jgi:hypothetical protein
MGELIEDITWYTELSRKLTPVPPLLPLEPSVPLPPLS